MSNEIQASKKILIVDDDLNTVDILTVRLKKIGVAVISTGSGLDALDIVSKEKPDLIILDIMLPQIDGYRICRMLKFDDRYEHIPIIILTARAEKKSREIGLEIGADRYITKPFDMEQLTQDIQGLLKEREKKQ